MKATDINEQGRVQEHDAVVLHDVCGEVLLRRAGACRLSSNKPEEHLMKVLPQVGGHD